MKYTLNDIMICIPTYKRKWPTILSLIRLTPNLTFNMFVRDDDYNNGYYNEPQFKLNNLRFITINDVHELGETRERMLQYAIKHNYAFCLQIDDSQFGLQDITGNIKSFSGILEKCLERYETDKYKEKAFVMNFSSDIDFRRLSKPESYFESQMCQTYLFNCNVCKQYDLHFHSLDYCGLEDCSFIIHAADKGLIELSDCRYIRNGRHASTAGEKGGCHGNDTADTYLALNIKRAKDLEQYVMSNNSIKDKKFLKVRQSILYPGTTYCKFDGKYARQKLCNIED